MNKNEVSKILNEIGLMLELKGESFFKSKAYYDGARTVELLEEDLETLVREDRLKTIKGFGQALTQKVTELITTGRLLYFEELKKDIPAGLFEMLKIPGLGPKKVKAIHENLQISTVGELKYACLENRLKVLPGFGEKTQQKILDGIEGLNKYKDQYLYSEAEALAVKILEDMEKSGFADRCSIAGSLRRKKEIVKDLDIVAGTGTPEKVMDFFVSHPLINNIISKGSTKTSVILKNGINADLRVVTDMEYPYALHHFTGSREHNTALRHIAKQMDIKVNEYGLFKGEENILCKTEEDIYKVFGMEYIPPELRENNGELEAALKGSLPRLVEYTDIKGIAHVHSNYSDGHNSIEELIKYSIEKGFSYLVLCDHSQSAFYANGLKPDDIKRQHEEIDFLNEKYKETSFKVFKGIESDILPDGSLDYDDKILSLFDFVIASVHSSFNMDEEKMTGRIINALKNKYVSALGHATGRLLLSREPYKVNLEQVIKAAALYGVLLEINGNPHRMDLDWRHIRAAKEAGCKFIVSTDAHTTTGIEDYRYGVNMARKGWLEKEDIVNCLDTFRFKEPL